MNISINKAAMNRKDNDKVFSVEKLGDFKDVQIFDNNGKLIAELVYTPKEPLLNGARAYLKIHEITNVRLG
jgi:hypothetical protein